MFLKSLAIAALVTHPKNDAEASVIRIAAQSSVPLKTEFKRQNHQFLGNNNQKNLQSFLIAEDIENPFQQPQSDYPPEVLQDPPMKVRSKKVPSPPPALQSSTEKPQAVTLKMEEAIKRPLEVEFSLHLSYAKLRNWNKRQDWNVDPVSGFTLGFRLNSDSNALAGLRFLSVTGDGTTFDSTGRFSFSYFGPFISHVEITDKSQTSFSAGFSLAKISGKNQVGPGEEEFSRPPGLRTDPPGLWTEVKYGRMTGGAWTNGITSGMQWGRKRLFYWFGLFTSAWH